MNLLDGKIDDEPAKAKRKPKAPKEPKPKRVQPNRPQFPEDDLRRIYEAYPRHTEPKAAMKAIAKALAEIAARGTVEPVPWLLGRVTLYASMVRGRDYLPYPATWMNKGRYDDDPKEWEEKKRAHDADKPWRVHSGKEDYDAGTIVVKGTL